MHNVFNDVLSRNITAFRFYLFKFIVPAFLLWKLGLIIFFLLHQCIRLRIMGYRYSFKQAKKTLKLIKIMHELLPDFETYLKKGGKNIESWNETINSLE